MGFKKRGVITSVNKDIGEYTDNVYTPKRDGVEFYTTYAVSANCTTKEQYEKVIGLRQARTIWVLDKEIPQNFTPCLIGGDIETNGKRWGEISLEITVKGDVNKSPHEIINF
ncbi:hypothetical protein ACOMHN_067694 [Nucella lapillus]